FALAARTANDRVRFNIETKLSPLAPEETALPEPFVQSMVEVIRAAGMEHRVAIESFDWRTLALVRTRAPRIGTVYLTAEQPWMDNVLRTGSASAWTAPHHVSAYGGSLPRMVCASGGAAWSPYFEEVAREGIAEAHSLGLQVIVWTVNDARDMHRMIEFGVDGIISDYPDLLARIAHGPRGSVTPRA